MKIREQLLQEIQSSEEKLLEQTLNFLRFLKTKGKEEINREEEVKSTGKSLLEYLKKIEGWSGEDLEECLETVKRTVSPASFDTFNPFDRE